MSVTAVWEHWDGRGATTDEKGVRTLKRAWHAETDSDLTAEPDVVTAVVLYDRTAALYAPHPAWPWAVCRKITVGPAGGPRAWKVEAEYSSAAMEARTDGGRGASPADNSQDKPAELRPPTVSVSRKEITVPLEKDVATNKPVANTMGDPFIPPPEVFRSHLLFTFKFFRRPDQLNWLARAAFIDTVNKAAVTVLGVSYPAKTLRCTDYAVEATWEAGPAGMALYFAFTVQVEYNPALASDGSTLGWRLEVLNAGKRQLVSAAPDFAQRPQLITDAAGQPVADPVPLDANSRPVAPGGPYTYLTFDGYPAVDWTDLVA